MYCCRNFMSWPTRIPSAKPPANAPIPLSIFCLLFLHLVIPAVCHSKSPRVDAVYEVFSHQLHRFPVQYRFPIGKPDGLYAFDDGEYRIAATGAWAAYKATRPISPAFEGSQSIVVPSWLERISLVATYYTAFAQPFHKVRAAQ